VLFDLGGVVCRFLPERRLGLLASASAKPVEEIERLLCESGFSRRCDRGELGADEMYRETCRRLASSMRYAEFRGLWASAFEPDPAVLSLVDRIRPRRSTGLLTDNSALLQEALAHELFEVGRHFDMLLFSCELGRCKPELELFRAALGRAGRPPDEVLFVDDVQANVDAAASFGIAALRFTGAADLERELAAAGLIASR
jgi:putative hydrolase of the HAD superfamily